MPTQKTAMNDEVLLPSSNQLGEEPWQPVGMQTRVDLYDDSDGATPSTLIVPPWKHFGRRLAAPIGRYVQSNLCWVR